ncbi:hypothetical protein C8R44DRAFT_973199 [Mycena epipterygia]|nr:hypothetical protein C8R44DRAFT_973199 [Mycena epipterygia]
MADDDVLPQYSTAGSANLVRRSGTIHTFSVSKSPNIVFTLSSSAPKSTDKPLFFGETLAGHVELKLLKPTNIEAIRVTLTGIIRTGDLPQECQPFLKKKYTIWDRDMGNPGAAPSSTKFEGKLDGDYILPFQFTLPAFINSGHGAGEMRLPQSFFERFNRNSVVYCLDFCVQRGKLTPNLDMNIPIAYLPAKKPSAPSALRQLAYANNTTIVGPTGDPLGWKTLAPVEIKGTLFAVRDFVLKLTLSLATPLCYTRGTAVPCHIAVECEDVQALQLMATPTNLSYSVKLNRRVSEPGPLDKTSNWKDQYRDLGVSAWWSVPPSEQDTPNTLRFDGEIPLIHRLEPTAQAGYFKIAYGIAVYPFPNIPGFIPADKACYVSSSSETLMPLLLEAVEIVAAFAAGPRPVMYTPPGYEQPPSTNPWVA